MGDEYKRIVIAGNRFYGMQLSLSAHGCSEALTDIEAVRAWITDLPGHIGMKAYGSPLVMRFGEGIEVGLSAVQLIETSAIVLHTNDGARDLYLDVFSCRDFHPEIVAARVGETFLPATSNWSVSLRQ